RKSLQPKAGRGRKPRRRPRLKNQPNRPSRKNGPLLTQKSPHTRAFAIEGRAANTDATRASQLLPLPTSQRHQLSQTQAPAWHLFACFDKAHAERLLLPS
ncbi:MAG: hypothetical protein ACTTKK_06695, partial [Ottowia sp.]